MVLSPCEIATLNSDYCATVFGISYSILRWSYLPDPIMLGKRSKRGDSSSGVLLYNAEDKERGGYAAMGVLPSGAWFRLDKPGQPATLLPTTKGEAPK